MITNTIINCEVCGNYRLETVLKLGSHPLCDDLVALNDSRTCIEYPIEILFCPECSTAHQKYQVPKNDLFPKSYHYRSRFTKDVLSGMEKLVDSCIQQLGPLDGKLVLDIGCNDGSLLDFFKKNGCKTVGIEPTDAYLDGLGHGHDLINGYFNQITASSILERYGKPDIITFTNVFAHIENLPDLIQSLLILSTDNTVFVIENHYLGAVIKRNQFDTFYHEHPRTYSLNSFVWIAKSLEKKIVNAEFPSRYGGNIRVFIGQSQHGDNLYNSIIESQLELERGFGDALIKMQVGIDEWKAKMTDKINNLVAINGKLKAKAFPGRAAILIKLLNLSSSHIEAVYEKPGSMKIGHYVPGTRIPIKSDTELFEAYDKTKIIINLAWHISPEIHKYLRESGYSNEIIDIFPAS